MVGRLEDYAAYLWVMCSFSVGEMDGMENVVNGHDAFRFLETPIMAGRKRSKCALE